MTDYLVRDEMLTAESAPAASPRTCEPGPDTLVLLQTANNISIAGGKLVLPGHANQGGCGFYGGTARARLAGQAFLFEATLESSGGFGLLGMVNTTSIEHNRFTTTGAFEFFGFFVSSAINRVTSLGNRVQIGWFDPGVSYRFALITRDAGAFFLIKGGDYADWQILKIEFDGTDDNLRVAVSNQTNLFGADGIEIGSIRLPDATWVPTPLINDNMTGAASDGLGVEESGGSGVARVDSHGSTSVSVGNLTGTLGSSPAYAIATYETGESDVLVGAHVNCITDTGVSLVLRYTDKDNCWFAKLNNASNTLEIIKREAAVETIEATANELAIGNAEFMLTAYAKGQTITAYTDHGIRCECTTASFNQNATRHGVMFEGTAAVVRTFYVFPVAPTDIPEFFNGVWVAIESDTSVSDSSTPPEVSVEHHTDIDLITDSGLNIATESDVT